MSKAKVYVQDLPQAREVHDVSGTRSLTLRKSLARQISNSFGDLFSDSVGSIATSRVSALSLSSQASQRVHAERRFNSELAPSSLVTEQCPMHVIRIQDLLSFDKLPNHDTIKRLGKFVVPDFDDNRPVIFISHQWCGYSHPDPSNRQFEVLQSALRSLRAGREVGGIDAHAHLPGTPKKENFAAMLENALIWYDYISVPQLIARHKNDTCEDEGNDASNMDNLQNMLKAINSVPAYIQRSAMVFALCPVVRHAEEDLDCQFSTWQKRGWCRLEANVAALVCKRKYMLMIESPETMVLRRSCDDLFRNPIGEGDFACCARNHMVEVDGVMTTIDCDRDKILPIISQVFENQMKELSWRGHWLEYRLMLSHEHKIFKGMKCDRPQCTKWPQFALEFYLDEDNPCAKCTNNHYSPLIYAVFANNLPMVRYLLACNADVHDCTKPTKEFNLAAANYYGMSAIHAVVSCGFGEDGKAIFDMLMDARADPYAFARGGGCFIRHYRDPFVSGCGFGNEEMVKYYMDKVAVNFTQYADAWGTRNEAYPLAKGSYELVQETLKRGAQFQSYSHVGLDALGTFCIGPKTAQESTDCRILDLLYEHDKLGDVNYQVFPWRGRKPFGFRILMSLAFHLRNVGLLKKSSVVKTIHNLLGGTALHMAVFRSKPEAVSWLLQHGANKNIKNKRGVTPLQLAEELGHLRCAACLLEHAAQDV